MHTPIEKPEGGRSYVETAEHVPAGAGGDNITSLKITQDSWWKNKKIITIALIVNMATFEYGLDQGMVNGFQAMPGFLLDFGYKDPSLPGGMGISTTVQQLITSLVSLGMFASTFVSGYVADKLGRKGGLWVASALVTLSIILQMAVINFGGLYAGRFLLGLGNGLYLVCTQLYMQETMTSNFRSLSYTFFQFWISFGTLVGALVNNATASYLSRASYRIPLGTLFIMPTLLTIALFFLPETPRYLASHGKYAAAEKSLRFLRDAAYSDLQVKEEFAEIKHALEVDEDIAKGAVYKDLVQGTNLKRTLTSLGLVLYAAASGIPFITQYGVYFFALSGDTHPFRDVIILVCLGMAGVMSTPLFTGKIGKRQILMFGGPYAFQVAGEVPNQVLRSYTLGLSSATTYLLGWSITFTIPYFINPTALNWGPKYGYIWVGSNVLIAVFTFFVVPETNKRTLEEIDECYIQGVPIRKFATYDCVASKNARLHAAQQFKGEVREGEERQEFPE
ncbi:hypothetical protein LTS07_002962 [Exophiala sideris]|uniref:Major facilitator superfamily (MFS) profile domain-containing protein n=1 Tax=Exophiala sideris TaxID=1016849 RepID=A0ABR0JKE6_9EURO|nr:hypothetical protein LTS07_002962 [Exophiala sideris]KAK5066448.1 hypothetical protein LTR69_002968 [Exophiala sideris]KAK5187125.1 hypothetical protein LTR44_001133 [Eurotiomycetes sp. CCFEE 6388]